MPHPLTIESQQAMDQLLDSIRDAPYIAVDTEFQREHTYYPHLALVQVAIAEQAACIDPLAFEARDGLSSLLLDEGMTRVFHSCSQDLEVLYHFLGRSVPGIRDTQIASALLGDDHQISYAALVNELLGIELEKSQTRTDWLRRPLSGKQLDYAADDVIYLYQLYPVLLENLEQKGRLAWFEQDCDALMHQPETDAEADDSLWQRVRGTNRLSRAELAVIQAVAIWREQRARELDRTRRRVIADDVVINIAQQPPRDRRQLTALLGRATMRFDNSQINALQEAIEQALAAPPQSWPNNRYQALDGGQKALLRELQSTLGAAAEELGIASATLYSRKLLEKAIRSDDPESCFDRGNWRFHCIGERLLQQIMAVN